jgi:hypothetical protein
MAPTDGPRCWGERQLALWTAHEIAGRHIGWEERSMSVTPTTSPETMPGDTDDGDEYAHYARADEITRAAIEGGRVTALCGFKFEPVRDPSRFPVCPKCKEFLSLLDD